MRNSSDLAQLYAEELAYLQELGLQEFGFAPTAPGETSFGQSDDPDLRRLHQGVAFLTAGLRARIAGTSAAISHGLAERLLPQLLRTLPATTVVELTPNTRLLRTRARIPRGRQLLSRPRDGTVCRFRTTSDVDLWPLQVASARLDRPSGRPPRITLSLEIHEAGREVLADPHPLARELPAGAITRLPTAHDPLFPWPEAANPGYRALLELFALPARFCFFDLHGLHLAPIHETGGTELQITFEFKSPPPLPAPVDSDTFRLHCTPAINLFEAPSAPLPCPGPGAEVLIRPEGVDPRHVEVYEVLGATAIGGRRGGRRTIPAFPPLSDARADQAYALRRAPSPTDGNLDTYLRLLSPEAASSAPPEGAAETGLGAGSGPGHEPRHGGERLHLELLCTNRELAGELGPGEIAEVHPSGTVRAYSNLLAPSPPIPLAQGEGILWHLLGDTHRGHSAPEDAAALRARLHRYNIYAGSHAHRGPTNARLIAGIRRLQRQPVTRVHQGIPIATVRTTVELDEAHFTSHGLARLFGDVLDALFGAMAPPNTACEFRVRLLPTEHELTWPLRLGGASTSETAGEALR